ncbi:MAG: hypothetical protein ABH858_06340 [Candidatus Omnitrophota bacterium]
MKGLTIIEIVMVIVLTAIIAAAIASLNQTLVVDIYQFSETRSNIESFARRALMRMAREIRMIGGERTVLAATAGNLQFDDTSGNTIEYSLNGTDLMRNSNVLCPSVSSLVFSYVDGYGDRVASPQVAPNETDIRLIEIILTVTMAGQEKTLTTLVFPRNFFRNR